MPVFMFMGVSYKNRLVNALIFIACLEGMYGADCLLSCNCQNKGKCNRFIGCQCPIGWRGQYCEKSGKFSRLLVHLLQNL